MLSRIQNPQSICILRLSAIGDVCHAVASVQAIQRRWPQAKMTWVIGKLEHQLLKGLPGVEFVVFDKQAGIKAYLKLRSQLKTRRFDILLHMQVALRASLATLCIKATEKWGFDTKRAKELQWLFCNQTIAPQSQPHVAEGFMGFAYAIDVPDDQPFKWEMPIARAESEWQQQQLGEVGDYLVIAPAASKAERNWLPERYATAAKYAQSRGLAVVICGGPGYAEAKLAQEIQSRCDFPVINLTGKTSLKQLLVILQKAKLLLAPDTGPAHMATTVSTPVVGLYAHSNPRRTGPYLSQGLAVSVYEKLVQQQTGKPLSQVPWGKRVKGELLMVQISEAQVITKIERALKPI